MNEQDDDEIVTAVTVNTEALYRQDKAMVDMQIATAKSYPRNIKQAIDNAVAVVVADVETAETCTYALVRKDKNGKVKNITGPSVHLAKIIAQFWGNMRIQAKVVDIDAKHITSQGMAWDLESNLAIQIEVKRSIVGKKGRYSEDMVTMTGNGGNSIALRNAVFGVVPRGLVDRVHRAAKAKITGDVSDEAKLLARRKQVVDGLRDTYSVTEAEILAVVGRAAISHITPDDIVILIGIGTSIKDGDTTADQAFRGKKEIPPEIDPTALLALYESKREKLTKKEREDAERIIFQKEVTSYAKLHKTLDTK